MNKSFKITAVTALILSTALLGIPQPAFAQGSLSFTGEQIFRGLFFGEAPVSELFPEIWTSDAVKQVLSTKDNIIKWNDLKEEIIALVKSSDSTFMNRFGQGMQSGDNLTVQAAMQEAGQKTSVAMQTLGYFDAQGNPLPDQALSRDTVIYLYGAGALYYYAAGAIVVVAAAALFMLVTGPAGADMTPEEAQLQAETMNNLIVERLAP